VQFHNLSDEQRVALSDQVFYLQTYVDHPNPGQPIIGFKAKIRYTGPVEHLHFFLLAQ